MPDLVPGLMLVSGGRDLVADPSPTPPPPPPPPHAKRKTEIGYCSLRKSVISPKKSEEVSDPAGVSKTGLVLNRITIVAS